MIALGVVVVGTAIATGIILYEVWGEEILSMMGTVSLAGSIALSMARNDWQKWLDPAPDNEPPNFDKMPNGNNKYWEKMFREAMRLCGIKEGTNRWRECHDWISKQGIQTLKGIIEELEKIGVYKK
jgi:hypothetical protein